MKPSEHKTVQARILAYAEALGWTFVPREEAEQRRGFDRKVSSYEEMEKALMIAGHRYSRKGF